MYITIVDLDDSSSASVAVKEYTLQIKIDPDDSWFKTQKQMNYSLSVIDGSRNKVDISDKSISNISISEVPIGDLLWQSG